MLQEARKEKELELERLALQKKGESPSSPSEFVFTRFMLDWLGMMENSVDITTFSSYNIVVKNKIIPYFDSHYPGLRLTDLTPKHIQDYYTYEMKVNGVSANTVIHRHANIRKALQYAFKTGLLNSNPVSLCGPDGGADKAQLHHPAFPSGPQKAWAAENTVSRSPT